MAGNFTPDSYTRADLHSPYSQRNKTMAFLQIGTEFRHQSPPMPLQAANPGRFVRSAISDTGIQQDTRSEPTVVRAAELGPVTISGLRQLLLDILYVPLTLCSTGPWLCSVMWNRETSNKSLSLRKTSRSLTDYLTSRIIEIILKPERRRFDSTLQGSGCLLSTLRNSLTG